MTQNTKSCAKLIILDYLNHDMADYSFSNLSSIEFEFLCRDLLQNTLELKLESFTAGADQGIDLRYTGSENIIIQCKKYKDFSSLFQNLKLEIPKVSKLKPKRYIIATSVGLLPAQKKKIIDLFSPFIQSTADILGRQDLNNILQQFPDIERSNYKLWLASTPVMERILHSKTLNDSGFVLDDIEEKIKYYVQNDSFAEALAILEKDHYVVISGMPGIGKTTLAEILSYSLLGSNRAEFVNVSNSIEEALSLFKEGVFQVFLFDDFLGSTFLDHAFQRNEDKQLLRLIAKVRKSKDKRLVLTTREYILNQATLKFESLAEHSFSKCIVDLSRYTTEIKAKIFYNHLYFNEVPSTYITELINKKFLFKIIDHRNYSPRIIDFITKDNNWQIHSPNEFGPALMNYFDKPLKIWKFPFEKHISPLSRILLYCLMSSGEATTAGNLYDQMMDYHKLHNQNSGIVLDKQSFKASLKELDNAFIVTHRAYKILIVNFQNPSIKDFLIDYIDTDESLKERIISSSMFLSPLLNLFIGKFNLFDSKRLTLSKKLRKLLVEKITNDYDLMRFSSNHSLYKQLSLTQDSLSKLNLIYDVFMPSAEKQLFKFIKKKFSAIMYFPEFESYNIQSYLRFLTLFYYDNSQINIVEILYNLVPLIDSEPDLNLLIEIKSHFRDQYDNFILENHELYEDIFPNIILQLTDIQTGNFEDYGQSIK